MSTNLSLQKQRGFTLIEIMVVVVIIGILATLIAPRLFDKPAQARIQKAHLDIQSLGTTLALYKLENISFPTTEQGLEVLVGEYLEKLPNDPWGNPYYYLSPGFERDYELYTYGADGIEGGSGENADIRN